MSENKFAITITNKKIFEFFQENPHLNVEHLTLCLINIIEQIKDKTSRAVESSQISHIFDKLKSVEEYIGTIKSDVINMHNNTTATFKDKLSEFKKECVQEINQVIINCSNATTDKQREHNNTLIENKINGMLYQYQSLINATEQRLGENIHDVKNKLAEIKETNNTQQLFHQNLHEDVSNLLKKMENSNAKGKISENILFNVLKSLFPYAQIEVVGTQKETGDIIMRRHNKPTILIENKNYNKNITQDEVKKFIRDIEIQNMCGLFLSQNFAITNKNNFEINFHNGNVLVYVHEVNYDAEKIKSAVDIIDNLKPKLDDLSENNENKTVAINEETVNEINKEYQTFQTQKLTQTKTIKESFQKILKQHEELGLMNLERFLASKFATSSSVHLTCGTCCVFVAKNQSALSAHQRHCKNRAFLPLPEPTSVDIKKTTTNETVKPPVKPETQMLPVSIPNIFKPSDDIVVQQMLQEETSAKKTSRKTCQK